MLISLLLFFFFFHDTATTEIYTLSLHDALPISCAQIDSRPNCTSRRAISFASVVTSRVPVAPNGWPRSEEHTSELQSHSDLVCRLLLEKKKKKKKTTNNTQTVHSKSSDT